MPKVRRHRSPNNLALSASHRIWAFKQALIQSPPYLAPYVVPRSASARSREAAAGGPRPEGCRSDSASEFPRRARKTTFRAELYSRLVLLLRSSIAAGRCLALVTSSFCRFLDTSLDNRRSCHPVDPGHWVATLPVRCGASHDILPRSASGSLLNVTLNTCRRPRVFPSGSCIQAVRAGPNCAMWPSSRAALRCGR
jgi:hypothetical protein